ncbi:MAG: hypothetical protein DMD53_04005 [Gemmatimonadetes bacterium]|nr:MAG: hypothetical protein DMD53_04005 [Gemmatimonadota bacterium]
MSPRRGTGRRTRRRRAGSSRRGWRATARRRREWSRAMRRRGSVTRRQTAGAGPPRAGPWRGTGPRGRTAWGPCCRVGATAARRLAARVHTRRPHTRGARSRWRRVVSLAEPQIRALVSRVPMASETLAGRTIAGYRLLERVGEGGTADVYRAEHPERGACAFKVLRSRLASDPTAVKRFLREAGYGSRVQHPGVVRTYDYGEADGLYYLALEWAEGQSLADLLHRNGPLAPAMVARFVGQLAAALDAAHRAGIIHRDLKPENIMYDPETESVKLLDFGIARDADLPPEERLTRTGFFVGTLQYVAPEALSGELVDGRADTYSLATITYYLLTGQHPYSGRTPRELFQQLLTQPPKPLSQAAPGHKLPAALEAAVMRGLARSPAERQPTVLAFAAEVQAALAAQPEPRRRGLLDALRRVVGRDS